MRTDTEAEASILWPPDVKNWLIGKDPNGGKDWRQEEEGTTENEMVGWHHQLDGHEFEQGPGVGDGQGSLACCSPWGQKDLDMTEWLNWTKLNCSVIPTLCDPQGISRTRILEWDAIPFTRACSWPWDWNHISCISDGFFFFFFFYHLSHQRSPFSVELGCIWMCLAKETIRIHCWSQHDT